MSLRLANMYLDIALKTEEATLQTVNPKGFMT